MIQRVQTLWMATTAGLVGGSLGVIFGVFGFADIWFVVMAGLAALVPIVAIFMFRNRRRQISMLVAEFVLLAGTFGFAAWYVWGAKTMWPYAPIPIFVAAITNWLALRGVLRDEMLVRGAERIR